MKLLSTLVLFLLIVWFIELFIDYTIGFLRALGDRLHWWTIRKMKRILNRIVKK